MIFVIPLLFGFPNILQFFVQIRCINTHFSFTPSVFALIKVHLHERFQAGDIALEQTIMKKIEIFFIFDKRSLPARYRMLEIARLNGPLRRADPPKQTIPPQDVAAV